MSTQLQLRRGTTAQHSTFTGASGEITIDTDKKTVVVHDGITPGGRALSQFDPSRSNRIINGDMTVAQRGTSGTNGGYSLDRWIVATAGTVGTWSQATGTFVNNQTGNFLEINGAAGNTFVVPVQRIESLNSRDLAGQTATVSYELYQNTGSAMSVTTSLFYANSTDNFSSSTLIANSSVQSVASGVVTKVTATFSIPSAATTGIEVRPCSQLQALGAGQSIQIGNVQLEKGSTATPFEFRPYGTELALCQRYYYAAGVYQWLSRPTDADPNLKGTIKLAQTMRANPTVTNTASSAVTLETATTDYITWTRAALGVAQVYTFTASAEL